MGMRLRAACDRHFTGWLMVFRWLKRVVREARRWHVAAALELMFQNTGPQNETTK
jgi:hypothetical protein